MIQKLSLQPLPGEYLINRAFGGQAEKQRTEEISVTNELPCLMLAPSEQPGQGFTTYAMIFSTYQVTQKTDSRTWFVR